MIYNSENVKLVGKSALIELFDPEDIIAAGGLVVKASMENQEAKGKVIMVGPAQEAGIAIGDSVLITKQNPVEILFNGKRCRIVRPGEILAILKKKE